MSIRRFISISVSSAVVLSSVSPAFAQTPGRLSDLVGARAGQAESELGRRGYEVTDRSEVVGDGRMTYWRRGDECIAIMTRDGRYQSINQAGRTECGGGRHDNTGAAVAAVAIVGLAAALAAHNRRHGDTDRDHDAEYERGYQSGLYGSPYDDRHETEGYHDGYLAGEAEASNRRHSNSRWVRQAPVAAQDACSLRADEFMSRPRGSSVPISTRDLGRGEWELTMATGTYRSVCRVTAAGSVQSIDPY
ncbi:hypothetical protein [Brevundimonas phoenicis]|uniref:hypothetical protein n=1 Tax=unclassified Brevundimonas TaxID=2622653 RepID=UPI00399F7011